MKYDEFQKAVDRIIEDGDTLMIHVSPDFQCDQTLGFPTSLCVCWEQGKARPLLPGEQEMGKGLLHPER